MVEAMQHDTLPAGDPARVALSALERDTILNLRCDPAREASIAACRDVAGVELPMAVNRLNVVEDRAAISLGPDEWLVIAPAGEAPALESALGRALADDPLAAVCDLSHNYTTLRLEGPDARDVLAKGCPLDLAPGAFGPGHAAQTLLASTRVLLTCPAATAVDLRVRNSFARYTVAWLRDAMAEFLDPG